MDVTAVTTAIDVPGVAARLPLLFLGIGPTEVVLIVLVFLMFFGVDRIPDIARRIGKMRAQFDNARREVARELKTEEQRADEEAVAFERMRERQIRSTLPEVQEHERLRGAAEALGLETAGKTAEDLRAAIRDATGASAGPR